MSDTTVVDLSGVAETSLWTLYNRACEATRRDSLLRDPECVRIYNSIDYDFEGSFGRPDGSHALRSAIFDAALRPWLAAHPGAAVVELGSGLETQLQRVDDGHVRWYCVDIPESIEVRERLLPPTDRCVHIRTSALDLAWIDSIRGRGPAFISAQGLFMYFDEESARRLFTRICEAFPGSQIMFDTVPQWFSRATLQGKAKAGNYRLPAMPWGINRRAIEATLRSWSPRVELVTLLPWAPVRGIRRRALSAISRAPLVRELVPTIVRVRTRDRGR